VVDRTNGLLVGHRVGRRLRVVECSGLACRSGARVGDELLEARVVGVLCEHALEVLPSFSPPEGHDQAVLEHMRSALGTPV
jgi:hypothetical protein